MAQTVFRTCSLCEAMCGLKLEVDGTKLISIAPDEDDVLSHGYICPKGMALGELHADPDRLTSPMRRTASGDFEPIGWDEALDQCASRLTDIRRRHGNDAVAVYFGNPMVHNHGALLLRTALLKALGTRNATSAGSQDTSPRFAASYYLYGTSLAVPIPDIDETDYFLCIGANPRVSNGSFLSAPNIRLRLKRLRDRGGRLVVVDPRRTETAREADLHVAILPGTDAAFLLSLASVLVRDGRVDLARIARVATGWETIAPLIAQFTPERVAGACGVETETIERIAREFVAARAPVAYSRVGVCNNQHGTLASYATDLLNLLAGRLGARGGAMFTRPPFDVSPILRITKADGHARFRSRVRGLPETLGDIPAATLAEEIETPGPGQVRAMLTFAGNPVLSTPNGRRLSKALESLEFMVSIDPYLNETTRHAHLVLPPASSLGESHVEVLGSGMAVRTVARYSPAAVEAPPGTKNDWQILLALIYRLGGGPLGVKPLDALYRWADRFGLRWHPDTSVDLVLRLGPYGDKFLPWRRGLNLKKLKEAPHGIDLGPMPEGWDHRLVHADRKIHLAAPPIAKALAQLADELTAAPPRSDELLLIGRREIRTCNSWLHNLPSMVDGRERCLLLVHPSDAAQAGLRDGDTAILESRVHRGEAPIALSEEMRPGVVSLPHGWGHAAAARWQRVAGARPGISINDWTDDQQVESIVGQSVLNGVRVRLRAKVREEAATCATLATAQ